MISANLFIFWTMLPNGQVFDQLIIQASFHCYRRNIDTDGSLLPWDIDIDGHCYQQDIVTNEAN